MAYYPRDGLSRLIYRAGDVERPTARKECGAREALARGLQEYLKQLQFEGAGGRVLAFERVEAIYSDLWTPAKLPSANVHGGAADGDFDPQGLGSTPVEADPEDATGPALEVDRDRLGDRPPPGHKIAFYSPSQFECRLNVEVWSADERMRKMLDHMLEDDLNPTPDWLQGGFRLELPHYCGSRADYQLESSSMVSDPLAAKEGKYLARYLIKGQLTLRVPRSRPRFQPVVKTTANGLP